jgi:hypothetical protein
LHAAERIVAVRFGGARPAAAHRIDHHQVGECQPGLRIGAQLRGGGVMAVPELQYLRTHQAEMQVGRGGARPAVEPERQGLGRVTDVLGDIGGIEHRGRLLAQRVVKRERARGGSVREGRATLQIDAVFGDRVARQQAQHARPRFTPLLGLLFLLWCSLRRMDIGPA